MDRFEELNEMIIKQRETGVSLMTEMEIEEFKDLALIKLDEIIEKNADVFKRLANR